MLRVDIETDLEPQDPKVAYISQPIDDDETEKARWIELTHGVGAVLCTREPGSIEIRLTVLTVIELASLITEWAAEAESAEPASEDPRDGHCKRCGELSYLNRQDACYLCWEAQEAR